MHRDSLLTSTSGRGKILERGFHVDWILLLAATATVIIGVFMVHATEVDGAWNYLWRQMGGAGVGFVAMIVLMLLPYQVFRGYVRPLYIFMLLLLVAVLLFGVNLRGTKGWFQVGPVFFQPSELAKILFVLTLAGYLDRRIQWYTPKSLLAPCALALVPVALILAQPDLSSSLVFFPTAIAMFFVAGARSLHLLAICLVGGIAVGVPLASTYLNLLGPSAKENAVLGFLIQAFNGGWESVWLFVGIAGTLIVVWWFLYNLRIYIPSLYLWVTLFLLAMGSMGAVAGEYAIKDYQRRRLVAFVNPNLDPLGGGYNVRQSQIAIGSGRILGKGYGQGTQSRLGFLPSRHTDFIFSVIGEELGFLRSLFVLGLYFLVVWRGYEIAITSRDRFGSFAAAGFATMFAFYALLNLGMTMGLAPVAGVPLPMVSYGGSSVVSSMMAVGILLSIHWRRYLL